MSKVIFPILYKYTQKGQIQQWRIWTDGDKFYTEEGIQGGTLTKSLPTVCKPKNVGKKNETTGKSQAEAEAQAKWQKKLDGGYNEILTSKKKFFEPMLAFDVKEKKIKELPPLDSNEDFKVVVYGQPKLDGIRADNANNQLNSRNGKPFPSCPHLYQNKYRLDGEMYNHDYHDDFNEISSLIKKQKPTKEDLEETKLKVQFWIFDAPEVPGNFSERYKWLQEYFKSKDLNPMYKLVPTKILKNWKEVREYQDECLELGFEGIMLRVNGPYENKRSKYLLKFKLFIDEEFIIVGAVEGEGGRVGTIGKFILQHDKIPTQTFPCNVKGKFDYLRELWRDRENYIGATATVKYQNRTPKKEDGKGDVPRFGYIIKLKREEYE